MRALFFIKPCEGQQEKYLLSNKRGWQNAVITRKIPFECEFLVESPNLGGPPPRKAERGQLARLWTYSPPKHPPPPNDDPQKPPRCK